MHDSEKIARKILSEYIASMPYSINNVELKKSMDTNTLQLNLHLLIPHGDREFEEYNYIKLIDLINKLLIK